MKVKILKVMPEILVEFIKSLSSGYKGSEYEIIRNALPDDVELLDVNAFSNADVAEYFPTELVFKLTSESFEETTRGYKLPVLIPPVMCRKSEEKKTADSKEERGKSDELKEAREVIRGLLKAFHRIINVGRDGGHYASYNVPIDLSNQVANDMAAAEKYLKEPDLHFWNGKPLIDPEKEKQAEEVSEKLGLKDRIAPIRYDTIFSHDGDCSELHQIRKHILSNHSIEQLENFKERGATSMMTPSKQSGIYTFEIDELIKLKNQEKDNV